MSLELKNVEKKVGAKTHIYSTNLRFEKNKNNIDANNGWFRQTYFWRNMV